MSLISFAQTLPKGHNAVNTFVTARGAADFITFLCETFDGWEREELRTPDRDGLLIHAEVRIGNATVMLADAKDDWPPIPALIQVYVTDAQLVLDRAVAAGGRVVTEVSPFWNGLKIARFADRWNNLWWLFQPGEAEAKEPKSSTSWQKDKPSYVYTSLMDEMRARRGDRN